MQKKSKNTVLNLAPRNCFWACPEGCWAWLVWFWRQWSV